MLAACAAPAIVKAEILMPVRPGIISSTNLFTATGDLKIVTEIDSYELMTGEVGFFENFRIVFSEAHPAAWSELMTKWQGLTKVAPSILVPSSAFVHASSYYNLKLPLQESKNDT